MKAVLFGVQKLDFKPTGSEDEIKGLQLHYCYVPTKNVEQIAGCKYDKTFVRPDFQGKIFGHNVNEIYNSFAKFKDSIVLPAEVDIDYVIEGSKAVFSGVSLIKSKDD